MATEPTPLAAGDRLGEFCIVRQLGEGGMGTVYLARDERLDRDVALKVIAPQLAHDPEFQQRFQAEARSAAAIDDPNVVPIFSAGTEGGRLFLAMRFVDGTDLRTVLAESGPLDAASAVAILADVSSALDAAHAAGFVHRDVKPANILLADRLGRRTAFLTDFGLTKGLNAGGTQLTGTGQWIGTLDYVAPEQMTNGRVDARTDVYALGCVLHEMLSGSVPFPGTDMQKMWGHVNEPLPALGGGEANPLEPIVKRATAKAPDYRFPSAGDLARAATAALAGTPIAEDERSVATGVAATGLVEVGDARTRTQAMKTPAPANHREQATAALGTIAPTRPRRRSGGGSGARVAAVIGGSLVLAAGLIGGALVLSGGKEGSSRTVVSTTVRGEAISPEQPTPEETTADESPLAEVSSEAVLPYSQALYEVDIPASWNQETSDEPNSSYLESVWRNPADPNTAVLIDAETPAPALPAIASAESVRAQTSQSSGYREIAFEPTTLAGLPAARWVFELPGDRRVDYFVNACNVGLAILGSTSPSDFGSMAPTFHRVASSVSVPCE